MKVKAKNMAKVGIFGKLWPSFSLHQQYENVPDFQLSLDSLPKAILTKISHLRCLREF